MITSTMKIEHNFKDNAMNEVQSTTTKHMLNFATMHGGYTYVAGFVWFPATFYSHCDGCVWIRNATRNSWTVKWKWVVMFECTTQLRLTKMPRINWLLFVTCHVVSACCVRIFRGKWNNPRIALSNIYISKRSRHDINSQIFLFFVYG